jgi:hypothetical protein
MDNVSTSVNSTHEAGETIEKIAIVVRRRSMGKHLLFSQLKIITQETDKQERKDDDDATNLHPATDTFIQVLFRRHSSLWDRSRNDTFPTKNSSLPYGAVIKIQLHQMECDNSQINHGPPDDNNSKYEVIRWFMLMDPRAEALKDASAASESIKSDDQESGISQHVYFKARMDQFLKYNPCVNSQGRKDKKIKPVYEDETKPGDIADSVAHGNKKHKAMRAKLFAAFLIESFGQQMFQEDHGSAPAILDVAGGKGMLSLELSLQSQSQCTIIDPLVRGKRVKQEYNSRTMKRIQKANGNVPLHLAQSFRLNEKCLELVKCSTIIVGLHPDECTEDIIDAALLTNKPAAIIPCCVFASLFPERKLKNGKLVCSYDDFLLYLMEKDERISCCALPFEGKNQVLVFDPR